MDSYGLTEGGTSMKKRKKIAEMTKKYAYLFSILIIFSAMGMGAFVKSLMAGQCSWDYIKKHISEPFWEGVFQTETGVVCAKEEDEPEKVTEMVKVTETPVKPKEPEKEKTGKQKKKDENIGVTKFKNYKPLDIQSPYYKDRGKTPLTTEYEYVTVHDNYFSDAAFIGDSRTLGLYDYTELKDMADFYCESGFSLYQWTQGATVTFQNTGKQVDLRSAMQRKTYGKVYIMIGMNDLGYGNTEKYTQWLSQMIDMVKETQPKAIIYLMGNLHMSKEKNNMKTEYNNVNINDKNVAMASLADGTTSFYLDCNPLYTDKDGYLKLDLSFDGCHIYGYCYKDWADFIKEHAVSRGKK